MNKINLLILIFFVIFTKFSFSQNFDWKLSAIAQDTSKIETNLLTLNKRLKDLESLIDSKEHYKIPFETIELLKTQIKELKEHLANYDQANNKKIDEQQKNLQKKVENWEIRYNDLKSKELNVQAEAIAKAVTDKLDDAIDSIKIIADYETKIKRLHSDNSLLKNDLMKLQEQTKGLTEYFGKLPTTEEMGTIVSAKISTEIETLKRKNWAFSLGIIGVFNDLTQDKDYYINSDTLLKANEVKSSTTLNFGILFGYYFGKKKAISIQTSLPILSLVNQSGSATLSTFMQRASGAIGVGISPALFTKSDDDALNRLNILFMWNVASFSEMTPGNKDIYLDKDKVFPLKPGETVTPNTENTKGYFRGGIKNTFAIGVSIRI